MKTEKPIREPEPRRSRPWEERDALRVPSEDVSRERRRTEEADALNQTLQTLIQS